MAVAPPRTRSLDLAVIADAHLGRPDACALELSDYLHSISPQTLVIVGDLVDMARARSTGLPNEHMQVLERVLELAQAGTRVYYVVGDKDAQLTAMSDASFGNLHFRQELELHIDGRRLYFTHGDRLETVVKYGLSTDQVRSPVGTAVRWVDARWQSFKMLLGLERRSLAGTLQKNDATAERLVRRFESAAACTAASRTCDTVVCGHTHQAKIASVKGSDNSINYLNAGDWVSSCTALEYRFGAWRLHEHEMSQLPRESVGDHTPERLRPVLRKAPLDGRSLLHEIVANGPTRPR